jgi:Bacterial Ig-like domain/WD40-like Beta Propeller Repeat
MGNGYRDPELDDVLQDDEMRRIATLLGAARIPEPPLDEAFRSGLRRQLMKEAWAISEGRDTWWRRAFRPPGIAWAAAAAGLVIIAGVVTLYMLQPPGGLTQVEVASTLDGSNNVALQQPILVAFNQPMDHSSTQAAVSITPATNVTYAWQANTLEVTPTSGTLAPNTQYQVTIGPGARTAAGQPLNNNKTITFVTQPPSRPTPAPTPRPTPSQGLGEKQLAPLGGVATAPLQWSSDSSTIYFVNAAGALEIVPAKGGSVTTVAPDGVTSPAISPAGDRIAYVRAGHIEVLTFASGQTTEVTPAPEPALVGWAKDKLLWTAVDGVHEQTAGGDTQLQPFPTGTDTITAISIAPDGTHVVYQQGQVLSVLDLSSGKSIALGQAGASFLGWSPDGTQLMYSSGGATVVSDLQGNTTATLSAGEVSWSTQDAILLGGETSLFQVRPDGSNPTRLSNGTYRSPAWAPNGTAFAFFRGGSLWTASAPPLPPEPTTLEQAAAIVKSFMDARLAKSQEQASAYLDASGRQAYSAGGLTLTFDGDPNFTRDYVLGQELTGASPDTARFVVRLVFSHGKKEVSESEETLVLVRDATTRQFLIDQATAGAHRDLGKGPEVVGVDVTADTIKITFDSDLDAGTMAGGIVLVDANGQPISITPTYADKVVTIAGLDLKPGTKVRLEVMTGLRDFVGHNVAGEYDLDLVGPIADNHESNKQAGNGPVTASPASMPSPSATMPAPAS